MIHCMCDVIDATLLGDEDERGGRGKPRGAQRASRRPTQVTRCDRGMPSTEPSVTRMRPAAAIAPRRRFTCVPVVVAGAAGGTALVATDRRTTGAQVDDEGIELKIATQASIPNTATACTST